MNTTAWQAFEDASEQAWQVFLERTVPERKQYAEVIQQAWQAYLEAGIKK